MPNPNNEAKAKLKRHQKNCTVCAHAEREAVDAAFISWESPVKTAAEHGLTRDAIYRHAHALGLFEERRRNVRKALERIIERAGDVEVTASAVVAAITAYSKLNSEGQWVDRTETVSMSDLFSRMSAAELETYARTGSLPDWFRTITGATPGNAGRGESYGK